MSANAATASADPTTDAVTAELEAMQAIAAALARVRDPQTRLRVLRWATDRFQPDAGRPRSGRLDAEATTGEDSTLAVESLYELFDAEELAQAPPPVMAAPAPEREPRRPREEPAALDALVRGFANEFQRLAVEWQRA